MNTSLQFAVAATLGLTLPLQAEVKVTVKRADGSAATAAFAIPGAPAPQKGDLAGKAILSLVDGERDANGGDLDKLTDGEGAKNADDPRGCFFFTAGTDGGRFLLDLGAVTEVKQVNTYSWHRGTRGPQVYKLYGSDGKAEGFAASPKRPVDPAGAGWKLIASVNARAEGAEGGQFAVSIEDPAASLGSLRYLLFDVNRTEDRDPFGNTFFSEIDVLDKPAALNADAPAVAEVKQILKSVEIAGGTRFTVETTEAPDLTDWAHKELIPVMEKWYPKIVEMLPSEGFTAPRTFSVDFTNEYKGVAATAGNRVMCSPPWYRKQLKGEALGSVVHELVHVVQQYRGVRGGNRPPGWLVEGLCDYIRWYLYEPESRGADLRPDRAARVKYDGSYRVTANFMNFVITKYDKDLLKEVNAAMRQGKYTPEFWKTRTGKTVEELDAEWKKAIEAGEGMTKKAS